MEMGQEGKKSFRDKIGTIDEQGKRKWLYPKKPKGKLYEYRKLLSYVFLTFLFAGPFIRIGGEPLLMLNVLERKIVLFGNVFWPQDFHLVVFALIVTLVFIILFTVVYGRIFCGWVCPQTIFMEMVFRRIEYLIEGDFKTQKRLNEGSWTGEKILKKGIKHLIFFAISFSIANTFLAYIIGSEQLMDIITDPPAEHIKGLTSLLAFTTVFYFVFSWFREQVCLVVCPYGRLQGVLLDRKTIIVAYDYVRGENRAKVKKGEDRSAAGKGDCIDCNQCVDVCPTGIDIRNGTQLECVNCTACIDACDFMMDKVGQKKGLIRYASEDEIEFNKGFEFTNRMKGYTLALLLLLLVFFGLFQGRGKMEMILLRTAGTLYQETNDGKISNIYNFKVVNKSGKELPIDVALEGYDGTIKIVGKDSSILLQKGSMQEGVIIVEIPKEQIKERKNKIEVAIYSNGEKIETVDVTFLGPFK